MIKVIAGNFKGRLLSKLSVRDIRPTQARVRKSIFQILEPLEGKNVLDLFAGTGILGIESISRGARNVIAVERNKEACQMIRKNINLLCTEDRKGLTSPLNLSQVAGTFWSNRTCVDRREICFLR